MPICPTLLLRRTVSKTRIWWQSATEALGKPPSSCGINTHDGSDARRRLVVSGIASTVVVQRLTVSFWKISTGRTPACSEPRIGSRSAHQISPRLTVIARRLPSPVHPHNRTSLLRLMRDLPRRTLHKELPLPCHPNAARRGDVFETQGTRQNPLLPVVCPRLIAPSLVSLALSVS